MDNFITKIIDADLKSNPDTFIKTRFPPEPNGYLHVGHVKAIWLNFEVAIKYMGQCCLRFDDTNPAKEDTQFIESIVEDIQWLGYGNDVQVTYTSQYFNQLYDYAVQLIQLGKAYVDHQSQEVISLTRGTLTKPGVNSPYRDRPISESLRDFERMKNGEYAEGECCLRAKIDMSSSFVVLRDPVLYRIKKDFHHQTAYDWCIYPMYDFAHCLSDYIENITHSLCSLEFQDNRQLYNWVLDELGLTYPVRPRQYEFSRLNFEDVVLSKRKLTNLVSKNDVNGWSDPRMPTISGLRRRGFTPSSIKKFIEQIGVTKQNYLTSFSLLENVQRKELESISPRAMAVVNPLKVILTNIPPHYTEMLTSPNHPNQEFGMRQIPFSNEIYIERSDFKLEANNKFKRLVLGKEVRLRCAYIIKAHSFESDANGDISTVYCTVDLDTLGKNPQDGRKVKGVIHWVCAKNNTPCVFNLFNRVFKSDGTISDNALERAVGFAEANIDIEDMGKRYQFERVGYFIRDDSFFQNKPVFNRVVSLRESPSLKE